MKITFTPMRRDDPLVLCRTGDALTVNGEVYDFSALTEGASLPQDAVACDWLVSEVARIDGVLHLSLILPHGPRPGNRASFPAPLTLTSDGPVDLAAIYDLENAHDLD